MDYKAVLLKRVDLKGLVIEDVLQGVVKAQLDKIVKDSSNSFDDMLMTFVYPEIEKAVIKWADEQLAKLQA